MVSENQEVHAEYIASEASDTPHDASGFEFHSGPVLLIVEGGSTDVDDGAYGAIRLFLFEGSSEASGASVAMEAKGSRRVDDRVPVREDKYWGCGEFREKGTNDILHCGGKLERDARFCFLEGPLSGGCSEPCWAGTCCSN